MKPNYTVIIHTPQELNNASYIQTGLFELEKKGVLTVQVATHFKHHKGTSTVHTDGTIVHSKKAHPKTSLYTLLDHSNNTTIRFAADLYDHAPHFSSRALQECDFYFKRNYESRFVKAIEAKAHAKVHKLGITFGSLSENRRRLGKFKTGLFVTNLTLNLKWDRALVKRLLKTYRFQKSHWNFTNTARTISRFEHFENAATNTIIFQTRCFLHEEDNDLQEIHQQRYRIIKLLRKNFPDIFKGGFIPSPLAKQKYADALTNVPSEPEAYLDAMKKAKIVIYTRGLANSPAWKMAEYLSQGKVIMAEPLTAQLPVPLTNGKELLYFENDTQLIENIRRVLTDEALAASLSKNARAYFEAHVHPVANVKRILELMLQKPLHSL